MDSELRVEFGALRERLKSVHENVQELRGMNREVGELSATMGIILQAQNDLSAELVKLRDEMDEKLDRIEKSSRGVPDLKTLITFAGTIIVPILLALIGAYVSLKTGLGNVGK